MRVRILLAGSNDSLLKSLIRLLKAEGYQVRAVTDGTMVLGVIMISSAPIDLIILNNKMPGMDGTKVIKELRENGIEIPAILFSLDVDEDTRAGYLNLGFQYAVGKPDIDGLISVVQEILSD